ncbi:hypothetical protein FH972_025782 [Carpinus fangiana]|uniref:tRNA (guanine-N(7)-)-methyltransferase non-catalytic subunit n=1 Tax=Carpinus fangiana TaxID=176857 RepID=A0A5N6L2F3_9ROSI|nr:hypothetical protein FH972_025782 [Carpinus fangiana]
MSLQKLRHPFQCLTRLEIPGTDHDNLLLVALGLRVLAVNHKTGAVVGSWNAESAGSKGSIIQMNMSNRMDYVALVTSEDKAVHILSTSLTCLLLPLNKRTLPKRPSCIKWSYDDKHVLVGDKFGDVYALPLHIPVIPVEEAVSLPADESGKTAEETPKEDLKPTPAPDPEDVAAEDGPPAKRYKPSASELTVHSGRNRQALENQKRTAAMKHDQRKAHDPTLNIALGHVSMLTALTCTRVASTRATADDTMCYSREQGYIWSDEVNIGEYHDYIITADRDEHIRISRGLPQTHIIENYCFGHTSFISALCVCDGQDSGGYHYAGNLLFSGGGDDWIGVWDWLKGTLICKIPLDDPTQQQPQPPGAPDDKTDRRTAVSGIWQWAIPTPTTDDWIRIAIACEGEPRIITLTCTSLAPKSASDFERAEYKLPGNMLDMEYIDTETIIISLDSMHEVSSTETLRDANSEKSCPRLFLLHNSEFLFATTQEPDDNADTGGVPFDVDQKVAASLAEKGLDVEIEATPENQAKMKDVLYGIRSLRKGFYEKAQEPAEEE